MKDLVGADSVIGNLHAALNERAETITALEARLERAEKLIEEYVINFPFNHRGCFCYDCSWIKKAQAFLSEAV